MTQPETKTLEDKKLKEIKNEVLLITSGISGKFVLAPKKDKVLGDVLIGLRRYRNSTRWKEFFLNNKDEDQNVQSFTTSPTSLSSQESCFTLESESDNFFDFNFNNDSDNENSKPGLGTNAKPTAKANAPIGSVELESFLNNLEEELISRVEDFYHNEKIIGDV